MRLDIKNDAGSAAFSPGAVEKRFKSLLVQVFLLLSALGCYFKTENVLFLFGAIYFFSNACILLVVVLVAISHGARKKPAGRGEKKDAKMEAGGEGGGSTAALKAPEKAAEIKEAKKARINFHSSMKKRGNVSIAPSKHVVRKYEEYKGQFSITRELEKSFKEWVYANVVCAAASEEGRGLGGAWGRPLTKGEMEDVRLIAKNGFICYDKSNETQSRAMFKVLYNYFNRAIPRRDSYYTNPMDEFVFENLERPHVGGFGLLIEDGDNLVEMKKTLNFYFTEKNVLYDAEGDAIWAFLLLLVFANVSAGGCLGTLSLRNIRCLPERGGVF